MQVHFGQIYVEQGAYFPFSHIFQQYISEEMSALVIPSKKFVAQYGQDWKLIFRISAKHSLDRNEIRGPTAFKKDKDVEYSIFLPFSVIMNEEHPPASALNWIFHGAYDVFHRLEIDAHRVREHQARIVRHICSTSAMFQDIDKLKRFNDTISCLDPKVWTAN